MYARVLLGLCRLVGGSTVCMVWCDVAVDVAGAGAGAGVGIVNITHSMTRDITHSMALDHRHLVHVTSNYCGGGQCSPIAAQKHGAHQKPELVGQRGQRRPAGASRRALGPPAEPLMHE